ncbi:MAG: hypothetical protein H7A25_22585 [Leptospiraceae bacterium]|nr:hypothetical protein [Leptospiraceae bacterium]MCP5502703.1 hypothetical protein [Leptospiraceae bacterium]
MKFKILLLLLLFPAFILAQNTKPEANNRVIAPNPASNSDGAAKEPENKEKKPLKYESGTVQVDPRSVSVNFKQNNLLILKKLKSSLLNFGMEEDYKNLMKSYIEATLLFQEKKYLESRRAFEGNYGELNEAAKKVIEKNKEVQDSLYKEVSSQVVELKIERDMGDAFTSSLEKNLSVATDLSMTAASEVSKEDFIEANEKYKRANYQLIRILYAINKDKNKNLKIAERVQKNLLIEEDYIPADKLKLYDEARNLIHEEREEIRKKEREAAKRGIEARYGDLGASEQPKDSASADKKAEENTNPANPADSKTPPAGDKAPKPSK